MVLIYFKIYNVYIIIITTIVVFVLTYFWLFILPGILFSQQPVPPAESLSFEIPSQNDGKLKFEEKGCIRCHSFISQAGKVDLSKKRVMSAKALQKFLQSGKMKFYKYNLDSLDVYILHSHLQKFMKKY